MTPLIASAPRPNREFAISVLGGKLREVVEALPEELTSKTADELELMRKPTEIDFFLRKSLWKQIEIAEKANIAEIEQSSIYGGVCTKQNYEFLLKNPIRVAYIMVPPDENLNRMEYGVAIGLTNLIEFISKPVTKETAGPFLKAMEMLINRVHGPLVQRVDARHLNMNKPITGATETEADLLLKLDEIKTTLIEARDVSPLKPE